VTVAGYLRFPHIHCDLVTFIAEDDVWLGPAGGGRAWRVSADQAPVSHPRISADGTRIAWAGQRDGQPEVYVTGADGGDQRRLTYWGDPATRVVGWTPDGEVLAVSATGQPFSQLTWAYAVPAAVGGGAARRLPFGPAASLAMAPGAIALLHGMGRDPAAWKRYRGGTAGRLWLAPSADGRVAGGPFSRLLREIDGQLACPMLVGGRLAFLSDHEGTGNLYSCALDGSDLRRHTDHDGFYARNAATDGTRIVYHSAGDIWRLDSLDAASEPRPVEFTLGSPAGRRARRLISAEDHLGSLSCDRTGRGSVVEVRGTVHWLTHRDGPARALTAQPGVRARLPQVLGSTGQVAWVTDAGGEDAVEFAAADGSSAGADPRRVAGGAIGRVESMAASPDGRSLAVASRDGRLHVIDVASGSVTGLASSGNGEVSGLSWSGDSAWLAWSHPGPTPLRQLRMAQPGTGITVEVTDGRFIDTDPVFTLDGLYLAFLSRRSFDPVYDAHFFDLSFPYGYRPFLVPLAAVTPSPFGPLVDGRPASSGHGSEDDDDGDHEDGGHGGADSPDSGTSAEGDRSSVPVATGPAPAGESGAGESGAGESGAGAGRGGSRRVKPVTVDADGLASRVVQVPVEESRYTSLRAVKGGLAWLKVPVAGELGEGGTGAPDEDQRPLLQRFDLGQRRCTDLVDELDWFTVSGDGTRLLVGDHGKLHVMPATREADPDNPGDRVQVDLSRARNMSDPAALWRSAYAEMGRIIRHDFWIPDMAGADWDGALEAYRPLLDRIAGPRDFADLLYEVMGELGSSHAYVMPSDAGGPGGRRRVGMLGADLERDPDGSWRVARILPGESSDPRASSPLAAPGAGISPGDRIVAIDGQPLGDEGPGPLLAGAAGRPVELTVVPAGGGQRRRAAVTTLRDDRRLRYQDWVAGRRRVVHERGGGAIGYLHVPDMVSEGWADFHRDLRGEMTRDALIIDVRGNRGGHTSQLVIEKLARRVIGWDMGRGLQAVTYPVDAPRGPVVALADEFAGSDGDIVTAAIKILGLGPVVGARTWGGVIGIDGFHELADGSEITVPRYATWLSSYGWDVENYGVAPDVEVIPTPDEHAAGTDRQLDTAIQMVTEALAATPAAPVPATSNRPSRRRPALPPRPGA
jgi:tricorn protease